MLGALLVLLCLHCGCDGAAKSKRREPNNVQCFKNADCISDCCISNNGWVGVCVGRPSVGQICGLFTKTMASSASSGGGGYNNEAWNSWLYSGMLSTIAGSKNRLGMAGSASAASMARGNMAQMGLAGGKVLGIHQPQPNPHTYASLHSSHYPADPRFAAYQSAGGYGSPDASFSGRHRRLNKHRHKRAACLPTQPP